MISVLFDLICSDGPLAVGDTGRLGMSRCVHHSDIVIQDNSNTESPDRNAQPCQFVITVEEYHKTERAEEEKRKEEAQHINLTGLTHRTSF